MHCDWNEVKNCLLEIDSKIFYGIDKSKLSKYEIRKMIFEYLCNNLNYDFDKLADLIISTIRNLLKEKDRDEKIKKYLLDNNYYIYLLYNKIIYILNNNLYESSNNPKEDIEDVLHNHKCLCHSASQVYKKLLELNYIYSVCVICDNIMPVNHQIVLVYDDDSDSYSFDDITSYLVGLGSIEECFDYDLEGAKKFNQGVRPVGYLITSKVSEIPDNMRGFGIIWPTEAVDALFGDFDNQFHLQYELEQEEFTQTKLPTNIRSVKGIKKL